jgi:hypothetical protein
MDRAARIAKSSVVALLTLLVVAAPHASAGRIPSPAHARSAVPARGSDRYSVRFAGGEVARVLVSGDGGTDLDLYVYDADGDLVASDTDPGDDCVVSFVPRWGGRYTIVIRNIGAVRNEYLMITN